MPGRHALVTAALVGLGAVAMIAGARLALVPYETDEWTWAPDRSPSGEVRLECDAPIEEAYRDGDWMIPEPPVTIPPAACRPSAESRLRGAALRFLGSAGLAAWVVIRWARGQRRAANDTSRQSTTTT